jgi:iron complex outermembrane receptor protein
VSATITCRVTDNDGNPLIGVTVATDIKSVGAITDENGSFDLSENNEITTVTFSSVGYRTMQFRIDEIPSIVKMEISYFRGQDILVTADRAELGISPIAFDNLSADEIERDYTVGEFPLLLGTTPNLHSYSDGGAPLGYSYTRIRGFDDKRIVTYINGVPLNDPEDHATYFVDLPDFGANVTDIQVQRGVGNSLYGDASFGGSINIVTSAFEQQRSATITSGYGAYYVDGEAKSDIYKNSIEYSSGLIDNKYAFSGRFSKQKTGGYRYNSWYEGWSYYFSIGRIDPNMTTELYIYGGPIRMHLSYWGAPRDEINTDRRYNPLTYSNETDNFNQPHYHLHNRYRINDKTFLTNTFYYIRGKGYYEQLKQDRNFFDYNIESSMVEIDTTTAEPYESGDLVRQQWVEKSQYGWNPRLDIEHDKGKHSVGGSFYLFNSDHWGQVVWAQHIAGNLDPRLKYYRYFGDKYVGSLFAQEYYEFNEKLSIQSTIQLRYQKYKLDSEAIGAFVGYNYDVDWMFLSPRLGVNYKINNRLSLFGNLSMASRTPSDVAIYDANDPDIVPSLDGNGNPTAKSERVYDFELGGNYINSNFNFGATIFAMFFNDEIIPYGGINESGILFTTNADKSLHSGIEFTTAYKTNKFFTMSGNLSFNHNKITKFTTEVDGIEFDFKDKTIPFFPNYIGNIIADYKNEKIRLTYSMKFIGKQFMELNNQDDLAIEKYTTSNIAGTYKVGDFLGIANMMFQVRIDNLFDKKYESSGYGGNFAYNDGENDIIDGWAEYYVASERSIYAQIKMELY